MEAANCYLAEVYMPEFNEEFKQKAKEEGSAFVPLVAAVDLNDILCEQYERTVAPD